jgi:hypothetical protein
VHTTLRLLTTLMVLSCTPPVLADTTATSTLTDPTTTLIKVPPQYTIAISAPADHDTFTTTADSLTVSVTVTPDLEADDRVTLYVDGSASGDPTQGTRLSAPPLSRGSHTLQAKITQSNGAGAESQTITVYQQGHGLTSPIPSSAPSARAAPMAPMAPSAAPPIGPRRQNGRF